MLACQNVVLTSMRALVLSLPFDRQRNLFPKFTHPSDLSGRHTNHQGVRFDIFIDDCARANESKFTNSGAAYDGAVCTKGGTFFHQGVAVFAFPLDEGSRVVDIGKHHAGATKNAFFERNVVIYADVVLDLAVIANADFVADEDVLAE